MNFFLINEQPFHKLNTGHESIKFEYTVSYHYVKCDSSLCDSGFENLYDSACDNTDKCRQRIRLNSRFLVESLRGIYFAM